MMAHPGTPTRVENPIADVNRVGRLPHESIPEENLADGHSTGEDEASARSFP